MSAKKSNKNLKNISARGSVSDQSGKKQALNLALAKIEQEFGQGAIMTLAGRQGLAVEVVETGSLGLDLALGVGGLPRGRVVEIFGPEASGKTTLAMHAIANAQTKGGLAAFIDAEHALDPDYAKRLGINLDELLISQPDTGEQALEIAETLVRSNAIDVLVIDSVAALVPAAEIEGDMGDAQMGSQARLMSQALRKLAGIVSKTKTVVIFINQIRHKIGVMFGNPETTPGGMALKFYSSVRLDIRRIMAIKEGERVVGARARVKVVKNKVASPFRQAEFEILYGQGISRESELIELGTHFEILSKSGAWVLWGEQKLGQGRSAAMAWLKANPKQTRNLNQEIIRKAKLEEQNLSKT